MPSYTLLIGCFFAILLALLLGIYLLYRENERLEAELKHQVGDPTSPKHQKIYQDIIEQAEWGVATRSADGSRIEFANPKFAEMHGYTPDEVIGLNVRELLTEFDPNAKRAYLKQIGANGNYRFEAQHKRKDGTVFPALVDSTMIRDGAGNTLYRTISVLDITEQKEQATQLERSRLTLSYIADFVPEGVWFANKDGQIQYGNPAARAIWGEARFVDMNHYDEYQTWLENESRPLKADETSLFKAIVHREKTVDQLVHILTFTGEKKTILNTTIPLIANDGTLDGALIIHKDVTDLRKKNEALATSQTKLRELVKHHDQVREDERRRIAREIHDELGQHMTALRLDTGMMRMTYGEAEAGLAEDLIRMNNKIDDSIQVVRNIASDLRPKALDMGFASATRWLVSNLKNRTSIYFKLDLGEDDLEMDDVTTTTLFRIVQESTTNILRHSEATEVFITLEKTDQEITLSIKDNGKGFDAKKAREKRTFGLLGMEERAITLGGTCELISQPGKGATIIVTLPVINSIDGNSDLDKDELEND